MKRFMLAVLYMLMLVPGFISAAMILLYLPGLVSGGFGTQSPTWNDAGLLLLTLLGWTASFVISWSGWRLLRQLYANADRY